MKPKVIIILNRLIVGGPARNTLEVINALKDDFSFVLITGMKEADELEISAPADTLKDIRHIHVRSLRRRINVFDDLRAFFTLKGIINRERPDVVHTIGAKPGILGRLAAKLCKVPVIIHAYHGHVFHSYFNSFFSRLAILLERWAATWTTRIITVSKKNLLELSAVYKIASAGKFVHVPVGIHIERFQDDTGIKRKAFRLKYFLDDDEVAVGIVGRIVPIKNHLFFLQVAQRISKLNVKTRFFVIGDGEKLRGELESFLDQHNIDYTYFPRHAKRSFLTFTSWITAMDVCMAGLDIVALTSLNEGTPVSVIEAQAAGKPVVSTNVGAIDEVMVKNVSGFLCDVNTVGEFTRLLGSLISTHTLKSSMGEKGKVHVALNYSIDKQIESTRRIYLAFFQKR